MKRLVILALALPLVLACSIFLGEVPTSVPQVQPTQVIIVVPATPVPATATTQATATPYPTYTPYPTPTTSLPEATATKEMTFVSAFLKLSGVPCSYYVTGDGFSPNTEFTLQTIISSGDWKTLFSEIKVKSNSDGHFSRQIAKYSDMAGYVGYSITTVAYSPNKAYLADAVETVSDSDCK